MSRATEKFYAPRVPRIEQTERPCRTFVTPAPRAAPPAVAQHNAMLYVLDYPLGSKNIRPLSECPTPLSFSWSDNIVACNMPRIEERDAMPECVRDTANERVVLRNSASAIIEAR